MRTRRYVRRCFAFAISFIMVWVVVVIPSSRVEAQYTGWGTQLFAVPSSSEVGSYIYLQMKALQPNTVYWLHWSHNGVSENGLCPEETITTDAEGRWTRLLGPFTPADVGAWDVGFTNQSYCGAGMIDHASYIVHALPQRLTVSNPTIEPGAGANLSISGAPPNTVVDWSTWKDGEQIEDVQQYGEYTDANGNFTKSIPTSQPSWNAQALYHLIGRADADGWSANIDDDAEGWLSYGPYTTQISAGQHTAVFDLMTNNNDFDNAVLAHCDVFDYTTGTVLASREIRRKQFSKEWEYVPFLLPFVAPQSGHQLEFRMYWTDVAYIRERGVRIDPGWALQPGIYMKKARVYNPETNTMYMKTTAYKVLSQPKFTFAVSTNVVPVNGYVTWQVTGAAPNTPIKWTRYRNGVLWDLEYAPGFQTNAQGNWSLVTGPWPQSYEGFWDVTLIIGGVEVTKYFRVGQMPTAPPPGVVYSYTAPEFDPGTGKYFSDVQAHTGGPNPNIDPIADVSARNWFSDAAGTLPAGMDLGAMNVFTGAMTSGNVCTAAQIDPKCLKCGNFFANECVDDQFWTSVRDATDSVFYTLACAAAMAIPVVGNIAAIICIIVVVVRAVSQAKQKMIVYKNCICTLPGKCSDNTGKDCSDLLKNIPLAKTLCQGLL